MLTRAAFRALSLCVVCWGCVTGLAAAEPLRIVTLGDSITKGVRPGVAAEETFAAQLQLQLRAGGHPDAEVVNVGVGGETAGQGLKRLENDVVAKKPAIVTIMYGHNDSYVDAGKTEARISIPRFRADLSQLVQRLRDAAHEGRHREKSQAVELYVAAPKARHQPARHRSEHGGGENVEGHGPGDLVLGRRHGALHLRQDRRRREGRGIVRRRRDDDGRQHKITAADGQREGRLFGVDGRAHGAAYAGF